MTVVKLGGSLAAGAPPLSWLEAMSAATAPLVLVPGGGPFADAVRDLQARWELSEAIAHRLAIRAMEQFGLALASLSPSLRPAGSPESIAEALAEGRIALWLPEAMTLGRPEIEESWAVTSDSLALWLAARIGATRAFLVKSAEPPMGPESAGALAAQGLVDAALPGFRAAFPGRVACLGPEAAGRLVEALSDEAALPGCEVLTD